MATTINGSAGVVTNSGAVYDGIQRGTAVSASGTSIDFTSIPSWVKRITLQISGVSTSGTSTLWVRVGSGSIATTGYRCFSSIGTSGDNSTVAYILGSQIAAANNIYGHLILTNVSGNIWVISSTIGMQGNYTCVGGGDVSLSGTLDRLRITAANGTDTFDAGTINIFYE